MPDPRTLAETESAMNRHIEGLETDFAAAHTVSSLYRAANAVRAHITNAVLRQYDLTWSGFVVMWVVWIWDGMETRHVAESAAISKATLTGVMKTLESRGWLIREFGRRPSPGAAAVDPIWHRPDDRALPQVQCGGVRRGAAAVGQVKASLAGDLRSIVRTVEANGSRRTGGCLRRAQRAASANARKMLACTGSVSAESSGCHWTPRYQPSWPSMVTASIVPSEACAAGRSPDRARRH